MGTLTVIYGSNTILQTSNEGAFKLKTTGKKMNGDITVIANSVEYAEIITGSQTLSVSGGSRTWRLPVNEKYMPSDIRINVIPNQDHSVVFSGLDNNFSLATANSTKNWDGTLEWTDGTRNWTVWDGRTAIQPNSTKIFLRGSGNTVISGDNSSHGFVLTGSNISCSGNIEFLLDYGTVISGNHPTMGVGCFAWLFYNCAALISAPEMGAVTLSQKCYKAMYARCTGITTPPSLGSMSLADYCYQSMFTGCTSLSSVTALPAITLSAYCYDNMYSQCTSITDARNIVIPSSAIESYSCHQMFMDCTSLLYPPVMNDVTSVSEYSCAGMFYGCSHLVRPPHLPATTIGAHCYEDMFYACLDLKYINVLPATKLRESCYKRMYYYCTSLYISASASTTYRYSFRIPGSGTGTSATDAMLVMFYGTSGSFNNPGTPSINTTYYTTRELTT